MAAARLKAEPVELKPLGRRDGPRQPSHSASAVPLGRPKAFAHPDIKPKVEIKPLPVDPPGTYMDYVITSSGISQWRHDIMKFKSTSREDVNPLEWPIPVKLNRKEPKKNYKHVEKVQPLTPMLGADGKPVVGPDGKIVMLGGPDSVKPANGAGKEKGKGKEAQKDGQKRRFKKQKTRQVFRVPDEVRQLRKEERHPWLMESGDGKQLWEGRLEDRGPQLHVLLFHSQHGDGFNAVPISKWYMFKERPKHTILSMEQAEQYEKDMGKHTDLERWMMRRAGGAISKATKSLLARGGSSEDIKPNISRDGATVVRSGGRALRVRSGNVKEYESGDDDDEGGKKRRARSGQGGDGEYDEAEFEEEFQDDDEGAIFPEDDEVDEDTKQLQDKEARMQRAANAVNSENRMDEEDEEEEEEDEEGLNDAGKETKKALKHWEKGAYAEEDDDEKKNPYLSDEDVSETEEESGTSTPLPTGVQPTQPSGSTPSRSTRPGTSGPSKAPSRNPSRASSPVAGGRATSPSGGARSVSSSGVGSSLLAKRATSPHAGVVRRPVPISASPRAVSPLAIEAGGVRANSPPPRAVPSPPNSLKRKADDAPSPPRVSSGGGGSPKATSPAASPTTPLSALPPAKKQRTGDQKAGEQKTGLLKVPTKYTFPNALSAKTVVEYVREKPRTTAECVKHFKEWFRKDVMNKELLSFWIKHVAKLENGQLVLVDDTKLASLGIGL